MKLKYSVLEGTDEDISWVYYTLEKDVSRVGDAVQHIRMQKTKTIIVSRSTVQC